MHPFDTRMHPFQIKKYDKDKRSKIISEDRDKRIVTDPEHQIQHFRSKSYYKASN